MTLTEITTWFIMAPLILLCALRTVLALFDWHWGAVSFYLALSIFIGRLAALRLQSAGGRVAVNNNPNQSVSVSLLGSDTAFFIIGVVLFLAFVWYLSEDQGRRIRFGPPPPPPALEPEPEPQEPAKDSTSASSASPPSPPIL